MTTKRFWHLCMKRFEHRFSSGCSPIDMFGRPAQFFKSIDEYRRYLRANDIDIERKITKYTKRNTWE